MAAENSTEKKGDEMRKITWIAPAAFGLAAIALASGAHAANDPKGIWLDEQGRGAVEIKDCGKGLCGTVIWVKSDKDKEGCGKQILGDVKSVGGGNYDNGWIYDPERGRKFDLALTPVNGDKLQVMGYAGYKFLSQTMVWTKAPDDLRRCDRPADDAAAAPAKSVEKRAAVKDDDAEETVAKAEPETEQPAVRKSEVRDDADQKSAARDEADAKAEPAAKQETKKDDESASKTDDAPAAKKSDGIGNIKIGDLELDKVFTRTKSGKCKVDLPFVKMTFDCEQR